MKKIILAIIIITLCSCCPESSTFYFYSPDGSHCVTYISQNDISYLIDGKHGSLPNENYVVLDVSVKDLEIDNFINICWGGDYSQYLWEITIEAEVLKSTLDTSKFLFESNLPVEGPWRIPTDEKFKGPNCEIIFINDLK